MGNYDITLQKGIDYTSEWRDEHPTLVKAFKIDKDCIDEIFRDNTTAVAIRAYLGLDGTNPVLVMVGVDSLGNDLTTNVYDHADPCPTDCDTSSPLNS